MKHTNKHRNAPAYWRIDETCIAEFDTVEEAERALAGSPPYMDVYIGDKVSKVSIHDIHIYQNEDDWVPLEKEPNTSICEFCNILHAKGEYRFGKRICDRCAKNH